MHQIGACLRENLRRYDSVGLTDDGAFVLVLPDISRRGLAGAAERLRRELGLLRRSPRLAPELTFALAHYDFVDASAHGDARRCSAAACTTRARPAASPRLGVGAGVSR